MATKRNSTHIKAQKEGKEIDQFMCFFCLDVCKSNHGHHIFLYSEEGSASTNNMITLCPKCHRLYHSNKLNVEIDRF